MLNGTQSAMSKLVDFLKKEIDRTSYRDVEQKTKISRGSLEAILNKTTKLPRIETLRKISDSYGFKLWVVMDMAGVELELPKTPEERAKRFASLAQKEPTLQKLIDALMDLYPHQADYANGMLLYLEASLKQKGDQGEGQTTQG